MISMSFDRESSNDSSSGKLEAAQAMGVYRVDWNSGMVDSMIFQHLFIMEL